MSLLISFILVLAALVIGEIVSTKTKAIIPSVFITAVLFLVGYWTIFPADIIAKAGFSTNIIYLSMYFLITHMGTMLSVRELIAQWKTLVISIFGICGICIGTLLLGQLFFSWDMLVVATPPLTGGVVASIIMSEAAKAKGLETLAVLAVGMYVMQGFAGYPLTAITLNMEGKRLVEKFRNGELQLIKKDENTTVEKRLIPPIPKKFQSTYVFLLQLGILSQISLFISNLTNKAVSEFVICLVVGAIAAELGFIERKPLNLSGTFGFFMTGLMAFIFGGLAQATPEMIKELIVPFIGIIAFGVIGLVVLSIIAAKIFKESIPMSIAISLNALYGFPVNYTLTNDAAKAIGKTDEEVEFLIESMLPKMLIGGFASVTIISVVIAGVFAKML